VLSNDLFNLLTKIQNLCVGDTYKVIEWSELGRDYEKSDIQTKELQSLELIKIKYADERTVAVAVTAAGRALDKTVHKAQQKHRKTFFPYLFWGLMLFAGGFIGAVVGEILSKYIVNLFD
jgi:hypothetical protein